MRAALQFASRRIAAALDPCAWHAAVASIPEPAVIQPVMTRTSRTFDAAAEDYRKSHLCRGPAYDATLGNSPFDAYMAACERAYLLRTIHSLFPTTAPRYLDFACGTGRITEVVAPLTSEALGVDVSPSMLDEARRKCPAVRFVQADISRIAIDLGRFDLVTSFRFFGNAQDTLRADVLRALNRLLHVGGTLIVNNHRNPYSVTAMLLRIANVDEKLDLHYFKLRRLLRRHGFEITHAFAIGAWMLRSRFKTADPAATCSRLFERAFGHAIFAPVAPDAVVVARKVRSL
jgi:ubiquinone/menaquinone biosynthesis C-methylase UbiE